MTLHAIAVKWILKHEGSHLHECGRCIIMYSKMTALCRAAVEVDTLGPDLIIKLSQQLSPQAMQNLEVLQMGSQQLLEYIERLAEENPTVEVAEEYNRKDEYEQFRLKLQWLRSTDVQNKIYYRMDNEDSYDPLANVSVSGEDTLSDYLKSQLGTAKIEENIKRAALYVIDSLDENGYLCETEEEIAQLSGCAAFEAEAAVRLVRQMEPAGVGCGNLSECLYYQLRRLPGDTRLAQRIVRNHLNALGKNQYAHIARKLEATEEQVHDACNLIRTLNPLPGSGFGNRRRPVYIIPDLFLVSFQDHFELLTNDYYFPSIKISKFYNDLYRGTKDKEVKAYLTDKLKQSRWVIKSIEQRKSMILKCAEVIVRRQESFFRQGIGNLKPMSLADIAEELEVHESTVSRALKDKYIQCSSGVYPLSHFFSRGLGSGSVSPDRAQARIREIIQGEDSKTPLSDAKISELLQNEGIEISRRTVAKYRDALGIGSTAARRQRGEM